VYLADICDLFISRAFKPLVYFKDVKVACLIHGHLNCLFISRTFNSAAGLFRGHLSRLFILRTFKSLFILRTFKSLVCFTGI